MNTSNIKRNNNFYLFDYWLASIFIWELTLHFVVFSDFSKGSAYIIPFSVVTAGVLTLITRLFNPKVNYILSIIFSAALFVLYVSELIYNCVFGGLYSVSLMQLGGGAITSFWKETLLTIVDNWYYVLIMILPFAGVFFMKKFLPRAFEKRDILYSAAVFFASAILFAGTLLCLNLGDTGYYTPYYYYYSNNSRTEQSTDCFGMVTTIRLEFKTLLFGSSEEEQGLDVSDISVDENSSELVVPEQNITEDPAQNGTEENITEENGTASEDPADTEPVITIDTSPNILADIDFEALNAATSDKKRLELNKYFSSVSGTNKNEYTGMFKGYNIIEICAESYSPAFVTEELTPALYKLTHEGIVFNNYYTSYGSVTTNAEYSLCTGLFPDLSRSKYDSSFTYSAKNYLPFVLGNRLKDYGYAALGFHNYVGSYFDRNKTHPNMGYKCYFANAGMKFTNSWPASDLEMMEQSLKYVFEQPEPYVAYYMTFSGHYKYDFSSNNMCKKNRSVVKDMPYSNAVKAYISCNMELEYALEYLLEQLEAQGQLDHTLIVMTGDHYPYGLTDKQYYELLGYTPDTRLEKFHNSLICWAAGMEEPIECDNYCCNIDILPTVLNLLGVDFDSRMLPGVDILSDGMHIAILTDESFLTSKMSFDSTNGKKTYFVDESTLLPKYFDMMVANVKNRLSVSEKILYSNYYGFVFKDNGFATTNNAGETSDTVTD